MLEGYKPIDFSSVFPPIGIGQMRNRVGLSQAALNILANSSWNQIPVSSHTTAGRGPRGEAPKREQTLLGRTIDLLSTPAYMVSNAVDDAVAGHQSSDTDSVMSDIGQMIGGYVTGAGRGLGTGLRGAFAPSEIAADPTDKQYLGDVLIRLDTHMSAEEALDPKNREEVRQRLMNKKMNQLSDDPRDKYFYKWDKGIVEVTDEDIDDYFKDMRRWGLASSMIADPLNFIKGPTGFMAGAKGTAEIAPAEKTIKDFKTPFTGSPKNTGQPSKEINLGSMSWGKQGGSYNVKLPPGAIQNRIVPSANGPITTPGWFDFPASAADVNLRSADDISDMIPNPPVATTTEAITSTRTIPIQNEIDPLDEMVNSWSAGYRESEFIPRDFTLPKPKPPNEQIKIANTLSKPTEIDKFVNDMLRRATTVTDTNAKWATSAFERLATKYPGIPFNNMAGLINHIGKMPSSFRQRLANPQQRVKVIELFKKTLAADIQAMRTPPKLDSAKDLINRATEINPVNYTKFIESSKLAGKAVTSKNPTRDAKIVEDVYKKFEDSILKTGTPSGLKRPEAWAKKVASGENVRYSGPQQVQMWNYLTSVLLKNAKKPGRFKAANNLLKHVEERFISEGAIPMSSFKTKDSVPLRLSQVLEAIGPSAAAMNRTLLTGILKGDPEALAKLPADVIQKIEEIKAGEALTDGAFLIRGVDEASKNIEAILSKGPLSATRTEEIVTIQSKVAEDITRAAGGSPVAAKKAAEITRANFIPKLPTDDAIKRSTLNTTAMISHPDVSSKLLKKYSNAPAITSAITQATNMSAPRTLANKVGPSAKVVEWLGARFNAAYRNADMREHYLRNATVAKSSVARRADNLNALAKQYDLNDADLWNDALRAAQGRLEAIPDTPAHALSQEILKIMENLFGSSGLKANALADSTVVGRSQLFMKELNKNLRRFGLGQYSFIKKGDYSQGINWLKSWESWNIEKPLDFLFKIQNVVEYTVREKIMFDEIVERFGTKTRGGEFTHTVKNHPRLAGYYFGKEAAGQIEQFVKNLKTVSQPSSKPMQHFDNVLSKWKAGVTIYIPSHHIRNMIGDVYMNWVSGVNSTRPYSVAMKVMKSQKGRYSGIENTNKLTSPDALKKVMATGKMPGPVGKDVAFTMKNGTKVTNDMLYVGLFQQGVLPTTRVLEDIPDDIAMGIDKIRPLGGKGQKTAHTISEGRDHYVRIAHAVDVMMKSNKSFGAALEDAARVVRKWHPDGMDLSAFERNFMRRFFPFYSWTRKAIPLIIESMVATPGKTMVYPKAQYMLQNMLGIETGPMSDPFPYDQLFPDWIREKGIGPVQAGDIPLIGSALGAPDDYVVINPSNPMMDTTAQMNNPGKMALGMMNPGARIPLEMAMGREAQTGAPIEGVTDTDYLAKQIPGVSHIGRATGEFGVSDTTKELSQGYNFQNILNMLTAMGAQNTKPYVKSAEFDFRDYLKSLRQ